MDDVSPRSNFRQLDKKVPYTISQDNENGTRFWFWTNAVLDNSTNTSKILLSWNKVLKEGKFFRAVLIPCFVIWVLQTFNFIIALHWPDFPFTFSRLFSTHSHWIPTSVTLLQAQTFNTLNCGKKLINRSFSNLKKRCSTWVLCSRFLWVLNNYLQLQYRAFPISVVFQTLECNLRNLQNKDKATKNVDMVRAQHVLEAIW